MKKGSVKAILAAVGSGLLLCAFSATTRAQEEVRLQTVSAYIGLQERQPVFPYISYISSQACSSDNCAVSATRAAEGKSIIAFGVAKLERSTYA